MTERVLRPQPGPQELFLATTKADISIYGGSAGAGKSYALTLEGLRDYKVPGSGAVFFRRTYPQLVGAGSLWEEMQGIYRDFGGKPRENRLDWVFPSGAMVELRQLQYLHSRHEHQSKQYSLVCFDELTTFDPSQFWFLQSRARTTCGVKPRTRAVCNPDPDSFVRSLIDWWIGEDGFPIAGRSGIIRWFVRHNDTEHWGEPDELRARFNKKPTSLTFIPALLEDNPALLRADPDYVAKLDLLNDVEHQRLRWGNWDARVDEGTFFKREWFGLVDSVPGHIEATIRAWDKAATVPHAGNKDPDWTRGVKIHRLSSGPYQYCVADMQSCREAPGDVDLLMLHTAQHDGVSTSVRVFQDPGQAGVVDVAAMLRLLDGFHVETDRPSRAKEKVAGPWSSAVKRGAVCLLRGEWNDEFLREHQSFGGKLGHDDIVDAAASAYNGLAEVGTIM